MTSSPPTPRPPAQPPARRVAGLTLIEVVAGLALLATLLVAVLTTKAKLTRQWASAQQRLRAAGAADALLAEWWRDVKTFPRQASGTVSGEPRLAWRTQAVPNDAVNRLGASVVQLDVIDDGGGRTAGEVLASVEVVLDDEPRQRPEAATGDGTGGGQ